MRPGAIVQFERMFLASLALGLAQAVLGWEALAERGPAGAMLTLLALTFGTLGGLVILVSRARSAGAKWLLVILYLVGLPMLAASFEAGTVVGWGWLAVLQAAMQLAALALLFTRQARAWLKAGGRLPFG